MNSISTIEIDGKNLKQKIIGYQKENKTVLSNYFGISDNEKAYLFDIPNIIIFYKKEYNYNRLYLITSSLENAILALSTIPDQTYVLNIPSKRPIPDWERVMSESGFIHLATYKRYYNKKIKLRRGIPSEMANPEDIDPIISLIDENFDPALDYNPRRSTLISMIDNNQIIVNRDSRGIVVGFLIYTIEGPKGYLNMWYDRSGNGLYLLYKVYSIMYENNIKFCYFWVNSENYKVIKLHEIMGAVHDGLSDFTFIKQ